MMSDTMDPDDLFLQIMEGVELEEPTGAINYRELEDDELAETHSALKTALFNMGQLYNDNPRGEAADLHAQFSAVNVEVRRRWSELEE